MNAIIRKLEQSVVIRPRAASFVIRATASGPRGLQGDTGATGADGDLPYFASAHAAIAAADKIAGQKADGTKGSFTVQQLIDMALAYNAGIKTANAPILNLSETWNNSAVAFTGLKYNVTATAFDANSRLLDLQKDGSSRFIVRHSGTVDINGALYVSSEIWAGSSQKIGWSDVGVYRDAANVLAQRNGVNAQTFRLYGSYTDPSNYDRFVLDLTSAGRVLLMTTGAGTGAGRHIDISANGISGWRFHTGGAIFALSDNVYDIGQPSANRPRNVYVASDMFAGNRLRGSYLQIQDDRSAPAPVAGYAQIFVDSADGDLKVIFGDGTIKTLATDT